MKDKDIIEAIQKHIMDIRCIAKQIAELSEMYAAKTEAQHMAEEIANIIERSWSEHDHC